MCIYIRQMPLCGHAPPTLLTYASCTAVLSQLMRITEPEAWEPAHLTETPFDLPDDCDPRPQNIWTLYSEDYCGWECRNNAYMISSTDLDQSGLGFGADYSQSAAGWLSAYKPGDESGRYVSGHNNYLSNDQHPKELLLLGMPDARYGPGSERLGIGWRDT